MLSGYQVIVLKHKSPVEIAAVGSRRIFKRGLDYRPKSSSVMIILRIGIQRS